MTADRRGFTIIELIVVSVLGAFVLGAIFQVLITNQRTYTAQSAVIQGQQSTRMSLELLFNELREVSPSGGDILAMSSDSLRVRLPRKFAVVCETDLFDLTPSMKVLNHAGERFDAADTVFIFAENYPATPNDDTWVEAVTSAVDTTDTCLSGRAATEIEFDPITFGPLFTADTVRVGAAVRSYRTYTFGRATFSGEPYLGRRDETNFMWPIAGPLRETNGIQFVYRDAMGSLTNTPSDVRQIEVIVRSGGRVSNSLGGSVQDSISAWIHTRN